MNISKNKNLKSKPTHTLSKLSIREYTETKNGKRYHSHLVQGWKEDGKWKRKKFKYLEDAECFVALLRLNKDINQPLNHVTTHLTAIDVRMAEDAFAKLKQKSTLLDAVAFYLSHHQPTQHKVQLEEAYRTINIKLWRDTYSPLKFFHHDLLESISILRLATYAIVNGNSIKI